MTGVDPRVLSQLAAHDGDVEHLKQAIRAAQKKSKDLDDLVAEYLTDVQEVRARITELKLQIRQAELEVADLKRQSKVHQGHLNDITDSREYRALNEEIRYIQRQINDKEEATLAIMEELEKQEPKLAEAEQIHADKSAEAELEKQDLAQEAERLGVRLVGREQGRHAFVENMPAATLRYYERRAARMPMPVVWMWEDNACGYCHHRLTPQARLEVIKAQQLVTCESCGRNIVAAAPVAMAERADNGIAEIS